MPGLLTLATPLSTSTRDPLRLPGAAMAYRIEDEFDPARNPQLVEDVEQIFLHRVLTESELARHFAIAESIRDQSYDLLLARRKQPDSSGVHHPQRRHLGYDFDQVLQLLTVGPHLSLMNTLDALA